MTVGNNNQNQAVNGNNQTLKGSHNSPPVQLPNFNSSKPSSIDYEYALQSLGYTFQQNDLNDDLEVNGERMTDGIRAMIMCKMQDLGFAKSRTEDVYTAMAYAKRYNPIKNYLDSLQWDGKDHIASLMDYLHFVPEHKAIGHIYFKRWLVGAVVRTYTSDPHAMLVLDGPQGIGKSFLARWLCPLQRYFYEGSIQPDDKDSRVRMTYTFVWEVAELQSTTRRADVDALKSFLTTRENKDRKPYARFDHIKPAIASYIGTINETGTGVLSDPTGNRRFNTVKLSDIDHNYIKLNINDIWAQAVAYYRKGETGRLSESEAKIRDEINEDYRPTSPTAEMFLKYFIIDPNEDSWMPVSDIAEKLKTMGLKLPDNAIYMKLAEYLIESGVERSRSNAVTKKGGVTCYKGVKENPFYTP